MTLIYPIDEIPGLGDGSAVDVGNGIRWLSMPLGLSLAAVNIWAVDDGAEWAIFDTGLRSADTVSAWRVAFAGLLEQKPLSRIFVTHGHPDHCGMAGWLNEVQGSRLHMSRSNFFMLRTLLEDSTRSAPFHGLDFYRRAGWNDEQFDYYKVTFGSSFGQYVYPLPPTYTALNHGDQFRAGGLDWEVIFGQGHIHDHCLFYCEAAKVLISGDQILPTISSNVSVHPQEPWANPLAEWIETLAFLKGGLPDDVLILPAHGRPFRGLHERIDALIADAESGLAKTHAALATPTRAVDLLPYLFKRQIGPDLMYLATGESLAHLACLRGRGLAESRIGDDGVELWFAV